MTTLLVIVWLVLLMLTVFAVAIHPTRTKRSRFELNRLRDEQALRRERLIGSLMAVHRVAIFLLIAALAVVTVVLYGWWSVLVVVTEIIVIAPIARTKLVGQWANRFYQAHEDRLLKFVEANAWLGLCMLPVDRVPADQKLESQEQLLHLVESSSVLTGDQLLIVKHGLNWHTTKVGDIMQPRQAIVSVKQSELLGPLVLDDLHKSGHGQFPVVKGSLDTVVGILSITELIESVGSAHSPTAGKVMSQQVVYVAIQDTLPQALHLLQKSKQHMVIVKDTDGKTVGLVTLADITGSLLGKTGVE